jgi:hypothetical protein
MKSKCAVIERRKFLATGAAAFATLAAMGATRQASAAGALPQLDEKDAQAQSLGYRHDTKKVDKAKFPKHDAAQNCSNCQLFQGKAGDAWGGCPIFAGRSVSAKGWCSAYTKKA